jgi:hypothetical protein
MGFTKSLYDLLPDKSKLDPEDRGQIIVLGEVMTTRNVKALIDGPYGKKIKLESYGVVLLLASGAGIAVQLPYIRQVLKSSQEWDATTQKDHTLLGG